MSTTAYNLRTEWPSLERLEGERAMRRHHIEEHPSSKEQHLQVGQWFDHNYRGKY
jgi:hypothetical protein